MQGDTARSASAGAHGAAAAQLVSVLVRGLVRAMVRGLGQGTVRRSAGAAVGGAQVGGAAAHVSHREVGARHEDGEVDLSEAGRRGAHLKARRPWLAGPGAAAR